MSTTRDIVVLSAVRTAIGGYGGRFLSGPSDAVWAYQPAHDRW